MNREDHPQALRRVALVLMAFVTISILTGCAPSVWVSSAIESVRSDAQATEAAEGTASTERFWTGAATVPVTVVLLVTDTGVTETPSPQPTSALPATAQPLDTALPAVSPTAPIEPTIKSDQPVETPIPPTTQPAQTVAAPAGDTPPPSPSPLTCNTAKVAYGMEYIVCVTGIRVNVTGQLVVNVTWTFSGIPVRATVTKKSDQGNRNMYLMDDLGNRYDHIGGGGAAYSRVEMANNIPQLGWFEFPAPAPGASKFSLHDDDQGLVLDGVPLSAPATP